MIYTNQKVPFVPTRIVPAKHQLPFRSILGFEEITAPFIQPIIHSLNNSYSASCFCKVLGIRHYGLELWWQPRQHSLRLLEQKVPIRLVKSFHKIFMKHLLGEKYCVRCSGYSSEQNRQDLHSLCLSHSRDKFTNEHQFKRTIHV